MIFFKKAAAQAGKSHVNTTMGIFLRWHMACHGKSLRPEREAERLDEGIKVSVRRWKCRQKRLKRPCVEDKAYRFYADKHLFMAPAAEHGKMHRSAQAHGQNPERTGKTSLGMNKAEKRMRRINQREPVVERWPCRVPEYGASQPLALHRFPWFAALFCGPRNIKRESCHSATRKAGRESYNAVPGTRLRTCPAQPPGPRR